MQVNNCFLRQRLMRQNMLIFTSTQQCRVLVRRCVCLLPEIKLTEIPLTGNTILAPIRVRFNHPINAISIAENPFSRHFGLHHSFFAGFYFLAFIRFRNKNVTQKVSIPLNVIQNLFEKKSAWTSINKIQFEANDLFHVKHSESLFRYLVCVKQNKTKFNELNFPHKFDDASMLNAIHFFPFWRLFVSIENTQKSERSTNWYWCKHFWPIYFHSFDAIRCQMNIFCLYKCTKKNWPIFFAYNFALVKWYTVH